VPLKFRSPGGIVCEIVPQGRYKKPKAARAKAAKRATARRSAPRKAVRKKK